MEKQTPELIIKNFNLNDHEKDSFLNGHIVLMKQDGKPIQFTQDVWFVWMRKSPDDVYKILLKTFNTIKERVVENKETIEQTGEYAQCGLGRWSMFDGHVNLYVPDWK
jgi:hypothetical protein